MSAMISTEEQKQAVQGYLDRPTRIEEDQQGLCFRALRAEWEDNLRDRLALGGHFEIVEAKDEGEHLVKVVVRWRNEADDLPDEDDEDWNDPDIHDEDWMYEYEDQENTGEFDE